MLMLGDTLRWSNCVHGQAAPTAVQNALKQFMPEFLVHIQERRCPAQVCRGLIKYEVDPARDTEVHAGAAICPTGAIKERNGHYFVDQALCIKCNACKEQCPDAIKILDAYSSTRTATLPGERIAVAALTAG